MDIEIGSLVDQNRAFDRDHVVLKLTDPSTWQAMKGGNTGNEKPVEEVKKDEESDIPTETDITEEVKELIKKEGEAEMNNMKEELEAMMSKPDGDGDEKVTASFADAAKKSIKEGKGSARRSQFIKNSNNP